MKVPKLRDSKGHVAVVGGLGIHRVKIHIYCNLIYHPEVGTAVSKVEFAKVCVGRLRGHGREETYVECFLLYLEILMKFWRFKDDQDLQFFHQSTSKFTT